MLYDQLVSNKYVLWNVWKNIFSREKLKRTERDGGESVREKIYYKNSDYTDGTYNNIIVSFSLDSHAVTLLDEFHNRLSRPYTGISRFRFQFREFLLKCGRASTRTYFNDVIAFIQCRTYPSNVILLLASRIIECVFSTAFYRSSIPAEQTASGRGHNVIVSL